MYVHFPCKAEASSALAEESNEGARAVIQERKGPRVMRLLMRGSLSGRGDSAFADRGKQASGPSGSQEVEELRLLTRKTVWRL
ncbi:hypothetical protein VZT92_014094 [Zoarces viviparus]|uniref:Uncharacterized protein n=1 Tax=Zoarces viviparus TaxID=48416 RepID=A0AAW1EXY9_ZOAVI